jgi:hypothetical protein
MDAGTHVICPAGVFYAERSMRGVVLKELLTLDPLCLVWDPKTRDRAWIPTRFLEYAR